MVANAWIIPRYFGAAAPASSISRVLMTSAGVEVQVDTKPARTSSSSTTITATAIADVTATPTLAATATTAAGALEGPVRGSHTPLPPPPTLPPTSAPRDDD